MSRIGKKPIELPKGVTVKIEGNTVAVQGPKGKLETPLPRGIKVEQKECPVEQLMQRFVDIERLEAGDIAEAIAFIVTRPRRVAVNELLVRPTEQEL